MELQAVLIAGLAVAVTCAWFMFSKRGSGASSKGNKEFLIKADEMQPGEMKELDAAGTKVLLCKTTEGAFHAVSAKCPHAGASLNKGVFQGDRVTCPWHGACFNVKTGDIEDAPSLDALHTFPTEVSGGSVFVTLPKEKPGKGREPLMCSHHAAASAGAPIVILGGGAAGAGAVEGLRQSGYTGRIVLITNEPHLPYDRVKLSKNFAVTADQILLRDAAFYERHGIEIITGATATSLSTADKTVTFARKGGKEEKLAFASILVATGGYPRTIPAPGADLDGIFTLRTPEDAIKINARCEGATRVAVVGSSFIGMEAAAVLKQSKKIAEVHVIGMEKVPFERVLGPEVGGIMQKVHEAKGGVVFHMQRTVKKFHGDKGRVTKVELDNDEIIECDFCVVGAGIIPGTAYLKDSGLTLERDGSIITSDTFEAVGARDVYIAGDIARFPYWATGETIRIEHWDVAMQQGKIAAANMAGKKGTSYASVPFFWTAQYGLALRYAGNNMSPDEIVVVGDHADATKATFVAYYSTKGKITAVATLNADPVAVAAAELIRQNRMPSVAEVRKNNSVQYLTSLVQP